MSLDTKLPLITGDGRVVTLISDEGRGEYPLVGYMGADHTLRSWKRNGAFKDGYDNALNLVNAPVEVETWCVIFLHNGKLVTRFEDKAAASLLAQHVGIGSVIAVKRINLQVPVGACDHLKEAQ